MALDHEQKQICELMRQAVANHGIKKKNLAQRSSVTPQAIYLRLYGRVWAPIEFRRELALLMGMPAEIFFTAQEKESCKQLKSLIRTARRQEKQERADEAYAQGE